MHRSIWQFSGRFGKSGLMALGVMALLQGCGADAQDDSAAQRFRELHSGNYLYDGSFTNKRAEVFNTQEELDTAVARYTNEPAANVDFETQRVLLVDAGERATGGYGIGVTSVEQKDDQVVAHVTVTVPGANCAVTEAVTNPYQFVAIDSTQEILVREELAVDVCNQEA